MADQSDLLSATAEFPDDAGYAWWRTTHPAGYVLAVSPKDPPLLHRAACPEIDRDRHPKRLHAAGRRQICADAPAALRAWIARTLPGSGAVVARCPKCGP